MEHLSPCVYMLMAAVPYKIISLNAHGLLCFPPSSGKCFKGSEKRSEALSMRCCVLSFERIETECCISRMNQ